MQARPDQLTDPSAAQFLSPQGEIVILHGREVKERRPLLSPLTLIGRADHCDIHLNGDNVEPLHCALVLTPMGPLLRNLQRGSITSVNEVPIAACHLRPDDVVTVGSFRFQVRWHPAEMAPRAEETLREKEALRIQAAAVVAQQTSLTEDEIRLQQRRQALEQQENQLATLLDEKQQRLTALRDETRKAHTALREERAAHEQRVAEVRSELAQARQETNDAQRQNQVERDRLLSLRHKLKRRWHRQWAAERTAMHRREAELARAQLQLQAERGRHHEELARNTAKQLRFNADMELGRRYLHADRTLLRKRRQELEELARSLKQRESRLLETEANLATARQQWEAASQLRQREMAGLENRIAHQRQKMDEQRKEAERLEAALGELKSHLQSPASPTVAVAPHALQASIRAVAPDASLLGREWQIRQTEALLGARAADLDRLAGQLADQRLYLAEQFERFVQARQRWGQDRRHIAAELDALGQHLQEQEQALLPRVQALQTGEQVLKRRAAENARQGRKLEARRAKLASEAFAWQAEREQIRAEHRAKEELFEQRLSLLAQLRGRWFERRQKQITWLRGTGAACVELRRHCSALEKEYHERQAAFLVDKRKVAEQSLALEQYRLECINKADDPVAADKRLEQLRQRWSELSESIKQATVQERRDLESERRRLQEELRHLQDREEKCVALEVELSKRQAASEEKQALAEIERRELHQQMHGLRVQRDFCEQRLQELRDEVERLARLLLEDTDEPAIQGQAA